MKKAELVFIPSPGLSHLVSTVELAKLLLHRNHRLSITILIMHILKDAAVDTYVQKISSSRLRFIDLQRTEGPSASKVVHPYLINNHMTNLINQSSREDDGSHLVSLVLDMFCTKFTQVGEELGIPLYVFFTSGACGLGLFLYLFPYIPAVYTEGGPRADFFLTFVRKIKEMKGIIVNSFYELEPFAIEFLRSNDKMPKVYPVGPILNLGGGDPVGGEFDEVKKWLDEQPESSVIFLCFGTMGSLEKAQVKQFTIALEKSGHRFLWSLRKMQRVIENEKVRERIAGRVSREN